MLPDARHTILWLLTGLCLSGLGLSITVSSPSDLLSEEKSAGATTSDAGPQLAKIVDKWKTMKSEVVSLRARGTLARLTSNNGIEAVNRDSMLRVIEQAGLPTT